MENAEEILQCLDEFAKLRPKEIPPELEYYLGFVARTGDPVYQWPLIKCLFREKLLNVITEFYEACPSIEIPPCPNVEIFNYEAMKTFILEKLDTFAAAPFTVQRICELLTSPRKEYNRIDKYMRALEKNILVVSTREPGSRKSSATENGESVVNGLESEHGSQEMVNSLNSDINVEVDMDEKTVWHKSYATVNEASILLETHATDAASQVQESYVSDSSKTSPPSSVVVAATPVAESVITTRQINYVGYTNEMLAEPSTTTTTTGSEGVAAGIPDKDDEHIYVTEEGSFPKADCSDMEASQIISETETEPITPPEPDKVESSAVEAVVESSSQVAAAITSKTSSSTTSSSTTAEAESEAKAEEKTNVKEEMENETAISSSDEIAQSSTGSRPNPEVTPSDHQEVTESNIVIGPEDMQVEDISPEPEADAQTEMETDVLKPAAICEAQPKSPETPETPETPKITETTDALGTSEITETPGTSDTSHTLEISGAEISNSSKIQEEEEEEERESCREGGGDTPQKPDESKEEKARETEETAKVVTMVTESN